MNKGTMSEMTSDVVSGLMNDMTPEMMASMEA